MVVDGVVWNEESNSYVKNTKQVSARDYYRNLYRRYHETQAVFSATFVKLRELRLGYAFPARLFMKTFVKGLNLSLVGRNLYIVDKRPGLRGSRSRDLRRRKPYAWRGRNVVSQHEKPGIFGQLNILNKNHR